MRTDEIRPKLEMWIDDLESLIDDPLPNDPIQTVKLVLASMRRALEKTVEVSSMTFDEAKARHQELHIALDELLACYISQRNRKSILEMTLLEFLDWAYLMTLEPSCASSEVARTADNAPTGSGEV